MVTGKTILFDLDGTLTDSALGITNSVMYALKTLGISLPERKELYKFIGPPLGESFKKFYGFSEEEAVRAIKIYREYFADKGLYENELYPDIPETLRLLKQNNNNLLVATSKPEVFARRIIDHFGLTPYFSYVAGADLGETRGEKANIIKIALSESGLSPHGAVMVGDREHDIIGAKKCGLLSVGVLYGFGSLSELTQAGADAIAEKVSDIPAAVYRLFN
jgi:phosphoglycolate phosphatase